MSPIIFDKGQTVWVIVNESIVQDVGGLVVQELIVDSQEWWASNKVHPVYYKLVNKEGKVVSAPVTGTHHFLDVFSNKEDADKRLALDLEWEQED